MHYFHHYNSMLGDCFCISSIFVYCVHSRWLHNLICAFSLCASNSIVLLIKVKLPIVNRLSHSSVTDASSAHLCFQGPEPAVCCRCLACHMGSHSITCHPIQANLSLPNIWEESQTSAYYCRNLL